MAWRLYVRDEPGPRAHLGTCPGNFYHSDVHGTKTTIFLSNGIKIMLYTRAKVLPRYKFGRAIKIKIYHDPRYPTRVHV
jgi:hypothetical protein